MHHFTRQSSYATLFTVEQKLKRGHPRLDARSLPFRPILKFTFSSVDHPSSENIQKLHHETETFTTILPIMDTSLSILRIVFRQSKSASHRHEMRIHSLPKACNKILSLFSTSCFLHQCMPIAPLHT